MNTRTTIRKNTLFPRFTSKTFESDNELTVKHIPKRIYHTGKLLQMQLRDSKGNTNSEPEEKSRNFSLQAGTSKNST